MRRARFVAAVVLVLAGCDCHAGCTTKPAAVVQQGVLASKIEGEKTPAALRPTAVAAAVASAARPREEASEREDSQRLSWKDVWLMLLGAVVSLYVTVVFERYNRFGELMRTVARARQHFEGYPGSTATEPLKRSHELSVAFFRLLDETEWSLNAEGHYDAATGVARLKGFIYREVACVENLLAGRTKGLTPGQYLSMVTAEYSEVWNRDFVAFERKLRPSMTALLRPYPHPVLPVKMTAVVVNYFDQML